MQTQAKVNVRWMLRRDMPEVFDIENLCFARPLSAEIYLRLLRQQNVIGMVVEHDERIVGEMIYELLKSHLHIINFAVHPAWQRRGVGTTMVQRLVSKLASHRRSRITLDVRETNLAAQLFFKADGFKAVRIRHAFFADNGEDAFRMEYRLDDLAEPGAINRISQYDKGLS